jgi:glucokinase
MATGRYVAGIDLGGTKLRIALVEQSGGLLLAETWPTAVASGPDGVIAQMAAGVATLAQRAVLPSGAIAAAGAGVPGPLNTATGVTSTLPNLPGWEDYPVRARLREVLGVPVALGNDANVAALGEHRFGAGRGVDHLVLITLGTGVGGGVITGGRLLEGAVGAAGEIGHMVVAANGAMCGCGRRGCLEAYASGTALERAARAALALAPPSEGALLRRLAEEQGGPSPRALLQAAQQADPLARRVLSHAAQHLAAGLVSVVHLFNPQVVLFGGGLTALREYLIEPAVTEGRALVFPLHAQGLRFGYTALGDDMGALGAAALALDLLG